MFRLFYTPGWFNGYDLLFECVILIIALLIAGYSWKIYRINKEDKFAYFSLAFILVSISLIFKMLTSSVLYSFPVRETVAQILAPATGTGLKYTGLFYGAAFLMHMASMLGAWLLIFLISQKSRSRLRKFHEVSQIALFVYLILLISVVSNFKYFVFYLTASVLLGVIVLNYYKNYLNTNRNSNAFLVMLAFLFVLAGNLFLVFVYLCKSLYVVGEILMLIGFLILLYTYRKIIKR